MADQSDTVTVPQVANSRFEVELEFLHCLASPTYLNFLAQNQYFEDPGFVRYLQYLLYWTKPEYAKFVSFPHSLYFIRLLQRKEFRESLKDPGYALLLHQQQGFHWQYSGSPAYRPRLEEDGPPPVPGAPDAHPQGSPSTNVPDPSPSPGLDTPAMTPGPSNTPAMDTPIG